MTERRIPSAFPGTAISGLARAVAVAAAALLSVAWFFRVQIGSGFTRLFGDRNDAVIGVVLLEHWRAVLAGTERWNRVAYFHPYPDTLGYNDGMLLLGLIHAPVRALGVDPLLSAEIASMALRGLGFVFFYLFARRLVRLDMPLSLLGAALVTVSGAAWLQGSHAQLFTLLLLPLLVLLAGEALRPQPGQAARAGWAAAAALLFGAWAMTAFYTAWFGGFFLLLLAFAAAAPLCGSAEGRQAIRGAWLRAPWLRLLAAAIAGAIALLPFLATYLPKAGETGMHDFAEAVRHAPPPLGLLNTRLAGGIVERWPGALPRALARANADPMGFAPLLLLLAALGIARAARARSGPLLPRILWRGLALATLASLVLVTWMPAWRLVYLLVPGARALRDIGRFLLVLMLPATLLALHGLGGLLARSPRRVRLPLLLSAGVLLLAEETARGGPVALDAGTAARLMRGVAPVPAACRAFYVTGRAAVPGDDPRAPLSPTEAIYRQNVDAMLIAALTGVPTVNGFSTFNPPDWDFARVEAPDYPDRVGKYAAAHGLSSGFCRLDLSTGRWTVQPALPKPVLPLGLRVALDAGSAHGALYALSGWNTGGSAERWTNARRSTLRFELPPDAPARGLTLHLRLSARLPDGGVADPVRVLANDRDLGVVQVGAAPADHAVRLPAGLAAPAAGVTITLQQPVLRLPGRYHLLPYDRGMVLFMQAIELDVT